MSANSSAFATMAFFIKCLENNRTEMYVKNIVENKLKYGTVERVEFIPRIDQNGTVRYKAAVVHMHTWNAEHDATHALFQRTNAPGSATKVFFQYNKYWFVAQYTPDNNDEGGKQQADAQQQYNAAAGFELNADIADQTMLRIQQGMPLRQAILHAAKLAQDSDAQERYTQAHELAQQEAAGKIDQLERTCYTLKQALDDARAELQKMHESYTHEQDYWAQRCVQKEEWTREKEVEMDERE